MSSELYESILDEIRGSHNLSKVELERIIDSQFRVIRDTMSERKGLVVQLIYLGKFRPTIYNQDYVKAKRDPFGVGKCSLGESRDREESSG